MFQNKKGRYFPKRFGFRQKLSKGQTALRFEASDEIANFVAGQELFYNEIKQPSDILEKIEAVEKRYFKNRPRIIPAGKIQLSSCGKA